MRPVLPPNFQLLENIDTILDTTDSAILKSKQVEFLISLFRCGLPRSSAPPGKLPPWGGVHALITDAQAPLMRVGFLPVLPHPVTEYGTVRKPLTNFQACRQKLNQVIMPIVSDKGVFHIVVDIVMSEPTYFCDLYPKLGAFHMANVLLRCAEKYLIGSGIDNAIIESEIVGQKTLVSVLSGGHYVRSFQGMLILSEMLTALA